MEQLVHAEQHLLPLRINLAKIKEDLGGGKKTSSPNQKNKLKYSYVFGKGQFTKRDLSKFIKNKIFEKKINQNCVFRELYLECGTYILFLEFEVNKTITIEKRYININIFSPFLLKINKRSNNPFFKHKIYKNAIMRSYDLSSHENRDVKNFSFVDLRDKVNGSEDLIIMQFFLKKEGTYLHYLINKSKNRRWKQKLSFKLENMKIINEFDSNDVFFIYFLFENLKKYYR